MTLLRYVILFIVSNAKKIVLELLLSRANLWALKLGAELKGMGHHFFPEPVDCFSLRPVWPFYASLWPILFCFLNKRKKMKAKKNTERSLTLALIF